jgi:predicted signal transduction protein with EAL and GGDEF domain
MRKVLNMIKGSNKHSNLLHYLAVNSVKRSQIVLLLLGIMQFIQLNLYVIRPNSKLADIDIILLKVIIVLVCTFFVLIIMLFNRGNQFLFKHAETLSLSIVIVMITWAVINSFVAQKITSDISIYLLVLFTIIVVVRTRPWVLSVILTVTYIFFYIGMPYFQTNQDFLVSHRANGLVMNIVAIIINVLLYKYAVSDYFISNDNVLKSAEIGRLYEVDILTGLYNHKVMHSIVTTTIENELDELKPFYLFVFDIDDLKKINKDYGHHTGDELLSRYI